MLIEIDEETRLKREELLAADDISNQ